MYYDIGAYNINYDEFKVMCHKAWNERYSYLRIDMTKNKKECKYLFFSMKAKPHLLNAFPKMNLFDCF